MFKKRAKIQERIQTGQKRHLESQGGAKGARGEIVCASRHPPRRLEARPLRGLEALRQSWKQVEGFETRPQCDQSAPKMLNKRLILGAFGSQNAPKMVKNELRGSQNA